jgi:hypothetical protein
MKEKISKQFLDRLSDTTKIITFRSKDKKYFRFEGKEYYAVHKPPSYTGFLIFTDDGKVVPEYHFPELWMYYQHQRDCLKLKNEIFKIKNKNHEKENQ